MDSFYSRFYRKATCFTTNRRSCDVYLAELEQGARAGIIIGHLWGMWRMLYSIGTDPVSINLCSMRVDDRHYREPHFRLKFLLKLFPQDRCTQRGIRVFTAFPVQLLNWPNQSINRKENECRWGIALAYTSDQEILLSDACWGFSRTLYASIFL